MTLTHLDLPPTRSTTQVIDGMRRDDVCCYMLIKPASICLLAAMCWLLPACLCYLLCIVPGDFPYLHPLTPVACTLVSAASIKVTTCSMGRGVGRQEADSLPTYSNHRCSFKIAAAALATRSFSANALSIIAASTNYPAACCLQATSPLFLHPSKHTACSLAPHARPQVLSPFLAVNCTNLLACG